LNGCIISLLILFLSIGVHAALLRNCSCTVLQLWRDFRCELWRQKEDGLTKP